MHIELNYTYKRTHGWRILLPASYWTPSSLPAMIRTTSHKKQHIVHPCHRGDPNKTPEMNDTHAQSCRFERPMFGRESTVALNHAPVWFNTIENNLVCDASEFKFTATWLLLENSWVMQVMLNLVESIEGLIMYKCNKINNWVTEISTLYHSR